MRFYPKITFARFGFQGKPFFVMYVKTRGKRDGRHLDEVGFWDPTPNADGNIHVGLNIEKVKYWLAQGARPNYKIEQLLGQVGVTPKPPIRPAQHNFVLDPWDDVKWRSDKWRKAYLKQS